MVVCCVVAIVGPSGEGGTVFGPVGESTIGEVFRAQQTHGKQPDLITTADLIGCLIAGLPKNGHVTGQQWQVDADRSGAVRCENFHVVCCLVASIGPPRGESVIDWAGSSTEHHVGNGGDAIHPFPFCDLLSGRNCLSHVMTALHCDGVLLIFPVGSDVIHFGHSA